MVAVMVSRDGKRKCDRTCHAAKSPKSECDCLCGGRYHGEDEAAIPKLARDIKTGQLTGDQEHYISRARRDRHFRQALFAASREVLA